MRNIFVEAWAAAYDSVIDLVLARAPTRVARAVIRVRCAHSYDDTALSVCPSCSHAGRCHGQQTLTCLPTVLSFASAQLTETHLAFAVAHAFARAQTLL